MSYIWIQGSGVQRSITEQFATQETLIKIIFKLSLVEINQHYNLYIGHITSPSSIFVLTKSSLVIYGQSCVFGCQCLPQFTAQRSMKINCFSNSLYNILQMLQLPKKYVYLQLHYICPVTGTIVDLSTPIALQLNPPAPNFMMG